MNPKEFYEVGEKTSLEEKTQREVIHCAYWTGVGFSKHFGALKTNAADNRAIEMAFIEGFLSLSREAPP